MSFKSRSAIQRRGVESLAALRSPQAALSQDAARNVIGEAREFGLGLRDFLNLAIDVRGSEHSERYMDAGKPLSGYEAALAFLQLPLADNIDQGIVLEAASDTFQTYPGTRMLFPQVMDDIVQWRYRQPLFETTGSIVAQSRTISGVELVTTVVPDAEGDYQNNVPVAELGRVPVKTIRSTEQSVRFFKHGGGLRISYEFQRRARLDLFTPFQARMARETEMSKVAHLIMLLINGDGVNPAAPVVNQSAMVTSVGGPAPTNGKISWHGLMAWFVQRAKAGTPVNTVVGNWDAYIQWLLMFAIPTSNLNRTDADNLAATGFQVGAGVPILNGTVNFAIGSSVPGGQLIGLSKEDTAEELIEAGSQIDESERAIQNQSITYVKTENSGYKLIFPDTRSIYNYNG